MPFRARFIKTPDKKQRRGLSPTQTIAVAFAAIILVGTFLLALPAASRDGQSCGFLPALFTATSSTCVTGLSLFDTWTQWSTFGQIVILCMIEIGGLGFMTAASFVIFVLRRKIGLRQRMVMAQALSVNSMESIVQLQKGVLFGSLGIQLVGTLILFFRFLPDYGVRNAISWGVFHSVSAFCNAGFDIFGSMQPGASVAVFHNDGVVCGVLMLLIAVGGLGFFVWEEVLRLRSWKKFSVYTKLVLLTTAILILSGWFMFCALEWNNPATLGNMPVGQKLLNGLFQSVTVRTAGFASIDQAGLTEAGKAVSVVLMLIGGSSGSTAGGIKTVTFLVLVLFVFGRARGKDKVTVFHRNVPYSKIMDATTIVTLIVSLAMMGAIFITATSSVGFLDALYETASALATVGLTVGVTPLLNIPAQYMIILFMYFGRVGILTLSLGFLAGDKAEERFRYADTNLLIG